jgi:hypothetical protein
MSKRQTTEPMAAMFLIEKLAKKLVELAKANLPEGQVIDHMLPMLEVIHDTAKTSRFSIEIANKQAEARTIQLGKGLSVRPAGYTEDAIP